MKQAIPLAAIALGVFLIALSLLWTVLFPPSRSWTEEKSLRLTELGNEATAINLRLLEAERSRSMYSGESAAELKEQYDKVSAEYKILYDEFHSASETPKTIADVLKWSGIGVALLGAAGVYMTREA